MSGGTLGGAVGYGIGQMVELTPEEAQAKTKAALEKAVAAFMSYEVAKDAETAAFRAQRLIDLTGELAGAAYRLQQAAYAKATT